MDIDIGSIESGKVFVKVLTSNRTSITLPTEARFKGKVKQPGASANKVAAEHGLSMWITITEGETVHRILFDAGGIMETIIENGKQFGVNFSETEKFVLSHGHFDHFGALAKIIPMMKSESEIILSPIAFIQNQVIATKSGKEVPVEEMPGIIRQLKKEGDLLIDRKLPAFPKTLIENIANENNVKIIKTKEPMKLYDGVVTSGQIELFDEDEISKGFYLVKSRKEYEKHTFRDENSIFINVKDKGLVILSGCGHTGILNTVKHAQNLTGVDKIYAVIGGFHKEDVSPERIEKAVRFLEDLNPEITCGMHCTGFTFNKLMARHPSHTLGIVGTEFHL